MPVSQTQFYQELYLEHLEEATYLYESLNPWRDDPEGSWQDCAELEARLEAHIDALVIADKAAEAMMLETLEDAEPGMLYAITVTFCRRELQPLIAQVWEALVGVPEKGEATPAEPEEDPDLPPKLKAVSDALQHGYPAKWRSGLTKLLNSRHSNLLPIVATTACRAGVIGPEAARNLLSHSPNWFLATAIRLLGDSGQSELANLLTKYLQHQDGMVKREAAIALLKLGSQEVLPLLFNDLPCFCLPIALSGNIEAIGKLIESINPEQASADQLVALGLSCDLSAVKPLVMAMYNEELAPAAAQACQLILGAHLFGEVFVAETFTEDELFPQEIEAFKEGNAPQHPAGKDFGENMELLSADPEAWRSWLREHRGAFDIQQRYILGQPLSQNALVQALKFPRMPSQLRIGIADRLAIQFKHPGKDFSVDDQVHRQIAAINAKSLT